MIYGRFERVADRADVLLFDYLQTAAFREALHGGQGIVVFAMPRLSIQPGAKNMLASRCVFVPVQDEAEGCMQVDFQRFADAIVEVPKQLDREVAQTLFPRICNDAKVSRRAAA